MRQIDDRFGGDDRKAWHQPQVQMLAIRNTRMATFYWPMFAGLHWPASRSDGIAPSHFFSSSTFFMLFPFSTNWTSPYLPLGMETIRIEAKVTESLFFFVVV